MKSLTCPGCAAPVHYDESTGKDFIFCTMCGSTIQIKEFVEVRHSGTIKIDGMANNERRIQMLFDYLDGIKNINFHEIASEVLQSQEDARVYLASVLLNPSDKSYLNKYITLEPEITEFEKTIAAKHPQMYFQAFCLNTKRLMYIISNNLVKTNNSEYIYELIKNDNVDILRFLLDRSAIKFDNPEYAFKIIKEDSANTLKLLFEKGILKPDSEYEFSAWHDVGLRNEASAYKYGFGAMTYVDGKQIKQKGKIPYVNIAANLNKNNCFEVFKTYCIDFYYRRCLIDFKKARTIDEYTDVADSLAHIPDYLDASEIRNKCSAKIARLKAKKNSKFYITPIVLVVILILFIFLILVINIGNYLNKAKSAARPVRHRGMCVTYYIDELSKT